MFTSKDHRQQVRLSVIFLTALAFSPVMSAQKCPPCYVNQTPLSGHGPVSSTDSRRVILVEVDTATWGAPPPANITNAVKIATDTWNSNATCYFFQVITSGTPDFLVASSSNPTGGCGDDIITSYPYTIQILNSLQSTTYPAG